ncbi:sugar kinase [Jiella marina]|uniref:sugar kinase n=1 Tax=Jiella sp. LLJ827 TaxID=2917712 RepID=UPI0021010143|nr:sugar kinase [Jiella sp. LLJ827]
MNDKTEGRLVAIGECMVELSVAGEGLYRRGFAGDTFNTAWHLKRHLPAGWQVAYLTALGTDTVSDEMLAFFEASGVATDTIRRIPAAMPGLYMIHLKNGERTFSYWRDTSAAKQLAGDAAHLETALADGDALYFSGITLAILPDEDRARLIAHLGRAKEAGRMVAFDPNIRPRLWPDMDAARRAIEAAAKVSTHCLPSFDDEKGAFGDETPAATARHYRDLGVSEIVVKDGAKPAFSLSADGEETIPSVTSVEVVDTTGAGDSFNAAYLAARLSGASPADATRAGHRLAARVVGGHGALVE